MKYTINDLKEGRIIVYKDVSNEDMFKLLQYVFPKDNTCRENYTRYNNEYNFFQASRLLKENYIFLFDDEYKNLPVVNASELLLQIKDNEIENNELNKLNDMKSKIFSVEGSNTLKKAFVEEIGFKLLSSDSINYNSLTNYGVSDGVLQGDGARQQIYFVLPKDWDKAIEFVKNFNEEEDIVVDIYKAEFFTDGCEDNYVKFGCHEITLEELKAIKTVMGLNKKLEYNALMITNATITPNNNHRRALTTNTINTLIERLSK